MNMSKLPILKILTSILFYVSMIAMIFSIPFVLILSIMPERVPFKFSVKEAEEVAKVDAELIIYIIALVISCGFFTYALYLFRKVLELFSKKIIFDTRIITNLNQCGSAILIGYFISIVSEFIYTAIATQKVNITLNFGLGGSIATICLGLFFIVLGEVFQKAKNIKEENDLTV